MNLWSLSYEKVESLKKEFEDKNIDLEKLKTTSITDMWKKDLDEFIKILDELEDEEE